MYAYAPNGAAILGTSDNCPCRAEIVESSYTREPDGTLSFEHSGSTEMFYNDQRTERRDGEDLYLDENGDDWKESEIVLREEPITDAEAMAMAEAYASAPKPQRQPFKVWVAVYEHRHGMDTRIFIDKAAADEWGISLADQYWAEWLDEPKPEDRGEMDQRFWDKAGEPSNGEWFKVEEIEVEGIAGNPLTAEIVSVQIPYREFAAQIARFSMPKDMGDASDEDFEDNIATLAALITNARKLCPEQIGADEHGEDEATQESVAENAPKHETPRILVLSTAHLREESNDWLLAHPADKWPFRGMSDEYGYFIVARGGDPVVASQFPEIAAAMERARALGCEYLLYDRDGDAVDGLETFEW